MTSRRRGVCCGLLLGLGWAVLGGPHAYAADATIENARLRVTWRRDTGVFSVVDKATGREFLRRGRLTAESAEPVVSLFEGTPEGSGQAIDAITLDGGGDRVTLLADQPFVLLQSRLANRGAEPSVTKSVRTLTAAVDLGRPVGELKTFGTGGLLAADKDPGSYAWLAVVEPASRNGVVFGWLTHDRGSGVLFTREADGAVEVEARLDYGRLRVQPSGIAPGAEEQLETLVVGYFDDARLGLEAWADIVAKYYNVKLPPQPVGYCTWYSRPHGGASDEKHLAELAEFAAKRLAPYGFSVVQIDDKWQAGVSTNGPKRNFTEHNPDGPYPSGMEKAAAHITSLGLTPGLWYMPFAGTHYDPFFKDRQHWFVKRDDGQPYETAWGGTCLDLTHPEVRDYVRTVADRVVNQWGFRYLKLDGLWTGTATKQQYVNSGFKDDGIGDAVFHDPVVTNVEAYRSGLRLIRETVGRDTFILGCNGPQNMRSYAGAFGLVDAMRVGPDNGSDWEKLLRGPEFGSRHYFLHGRVWYNDPDPTYVREEMPLNHAQLVCSWVAISGQLNLSSEWLPGLPPERLAILQRTMPGHGLLPRPVDLFEHDPPRIWLLTDTRGKVRRDVIGIFNWTDEELAVDESLERLGLDPAVQYEAFDYWANERAAPIKDRLQTSVPAQSCRILAVRPQADHPQVISASRHVTQGIVDLTDETWDATTRTLSGVSDVIGGDKYELRIVLPQEGDEWTIETVEAPAAGKLSQEGALVRAVFTAPDSGKISWAVKFAQ